MKPESTDRLYRELILLRQENQSLRSRCASLEAQVMELAVQAEPPPGWWENVIILFSDSDDEDDTPQDAPPGA